MARFDYVGMRCPLCGRADLWAWTPGSVRCCTCRSIMPRAWLVDLVGRAKEGAARQDDAVLGARCYEGKMKGPA